MRYGMVIDQMRCIGCHTCAMACKIENNLTDGIWWNRILTMSRDAAHKHEGYITLACQHCENPPCVEACPTGATYKEEATGIVVQTPSKCRGCRRCMIACAFTGARQFISREPRFAAGIAVGSADAITHQKKKVEKCTFCSHRLAKGEPPFCVECCPALARHFGDLSDPESEVSRLLRRRPHFQLRADEGTKPSVYFLTDVLKCQGGT